MAVKEKWLLKFWYRPQLIAYLLYPFHLLMYLLVSIRQLCYKRSLFKSTKVSVPVIVVGNITLGGTGKSPLVMHLAEGLSKLGYHVGILSRGYGGYSEHYPHEVLNTSTADIVGDEPLMIKQRLTDLTVVVDPNRVRGAQHLINQFQCDVIICDDGLQHYALERDIEFVVVDGQRNLGNRLLMPFGPLREPVSRLNAVEGVIINNPTTDSILPIDASLVFAMTLEPKEFVSLTGAKSLSIAELLKKAQGTAIHGMAAIGNPERFFNTLSTLGFDVISHGYSDHHHFQEDDFNKMHGTIIMTEKDAVKCQQFATDDMWYLKAEASVKQSIVQHCHQLLLNK